MRWSDMGINTASHRFVYTPVCVAMLSSAPRQKKRRDAAFEPQITNKIVCLFATMLDRK